VRHYFFQAFAATCWFALYLAVVVLIAQIMHRVSAHYAPVPEDQALTELRKRIEENRRAIVAREEKAYQMATRIIIDEEIAKECAQYEEDLEREASAILSRLDDEAKADFQALARRSA
jgi:hypothetical protein